MKCEKCGHEIKDLSTAEQFNGSHKWYCEVCPRPMMQEEMGTFKQSVIKLSRVPCPHIEGNTCAVAKFADGTHVPHHEYHSPNGYEWGYGGSGPADLARSVIFAWIKNPANPTMCYQDYKWACIAKMPTEGGTVTKAAVQAWYEEWEVELTARCANR